MGLDSVQISVTGGKGAELMTHPVKANKEQ